MKTKQITFSAIALALAIIISTIIKLPSLPMGGSITLFSMLIICLVGYWYGPAISLTVAVIYGILQFILGPFIVHPLQVILDYPLAFGALGLAGFFNKRKNGLVIGYIVGILGRLFFHIISGLIFYTTYVSNLKGNLIVIGTVLIYNASYVLIEGAMTLALISLPAVKHMLEKLKQLALS